MYKPAEIKKWSDKAGELEFKFCPKVYNGISHFGSLNGKKFLTDAFLESIVGFKNHLGPVFLQVSDKFAPKRKEELYHYLETLPKDVQFFLEVRHPDWFIEPNSKNFLRY